MKVIMSDTNEIIRIPFPGMKSEFQRILEKLSFAALKADTLAEIFARNSLDGVYSHGVNRFPRFVDYVKQGYVFPDAEPSLIHKTGGVEQWDGNLGPGPLNAVFATDRAMALAEKNGIGMVSLANTNHWMRGGSYGWQAAGKGMVFICWTNTEANMPAWGAVDPHLGNNPLVFAVPFENEAIVLDFAMSQFSYGKMEAYELKGETLPYPGGFDRMGHLSTDPSLVLETKRTLPAGYWKGSGLSLLLDILAAILSGGKSTCEISDTTVETSLSQVFIAVSIRSLVNYPSVESAIKRIISDLKESIPSDPGSPVRYPGENVIMTRERNLNNGIPVSREIWEKIIAL
jgi:3-dehydro-L-gulonate 2-dehydrogenase